MECCEKCGLGIGILKWAIEDARLARDCASRAAILASDAAEKYAVVTKHLEEEVARVCRVGIAEAQNAVATLQAR